MWLVRRKHLLQERVARLAAEKAVDELTQRNALLRTDLSHRSEEIMKLHREILKLREEAKGKD